MAKTEKPARPKMGPSTMDVEIKDIVENPNNPRTNIESIEDLKASIKANGLLQPIAVRINDKNKFEVMAGSRRFMACKELGLKKIPCTIFHDIDDDKAYEIATTENIVRENMTAVDEANAVAKLFSQGKSRTEIGALFGKSARWAEGRRRIVELGDKAMEYLAAGKINLGHAEVLTMCRKEDVDGLLNVALWKSPEDLKSYIMNQKPLLERAPFNAKKVCKDCENRSDCQRDLFGDVQNSYCLDRDCFINNVKKEAEHWRKKFLKEGLEEVPEDDLWDAQHEYSGYVSTSSGEDNEDDDKFIKECIAKGMKPMFWVDEDTAEWGHVFRRENENSDDDDSDDDDTEDNSWSRQKNRMDYERLAEIRKIASQEEKNIVANKLKGVFGNISRDAQAFILAALDRCYTDEEGNEKNYLEDVYRASDDFIDEVATALTEGWNGLDNDIRKYLGMDSREEFEQRANNELPEDWEPEEEKDDADEKVDESANETTESEEEEEF